MHGAVGIDGALDSVNLCSVASGRETCYVKSQSCRRGRFDFAMGVFEDSRNIFAVGNCCWAWLEERTRALLSCRFEAHSEYERIDQLERPCQAFFQFFLGPFFFLVLEGAYRNRGGK